MTDHAELSHSLDLFDTLQYVLCMEWWTIVAAIIGVLGGILGMISFTRTVKRQRPRFRVTVDRPSILYGQGEKAEFLIVDICVSNLSDVPNSIVEYGLVIGHPHSLSTEPIHYSENDLGESILETTDMTKRLAVRNTRFDWLETPVNLTPHNSASGFIGFPLPSIPRPLVKSIEYAIIVMPSEGQPSLIPLILDNYEWRIAQHTITQHDPSSLDE